jgi:VIT1/CCC1 family predicted Fe2+/Mn2+ transporter
LNTTEDTGGRLNWLRAGLLGAIDGIVSVAAVIIGLVAAHSATHLVLLAGLAALLGGAFSMALGEYVSVSSQRDLQRALNKGKAKAQHEASPWVAGLASALAFLAGGAVPLLMGVLLPQPLRLVVTGVAVILALGVAGLFAARIGHGKVTRVVLRVIIGGVLALVVSFALGALLDTTGVV